MTNRTAISYVISVMVAAVLFGVGAITVLSIPALSRNAMVLLPLVVVASILLTPMISWQIAPRLRARFVRERSD